MKYYLSFIFALCSCFCFAGSEGVPSGQNNKIDSLLSLLKTDKEDTNKVNRLSDLAWEHMYQNPDTSILLSEEALLMAEKIKFEFGIGKACNNLGVFNTFKGDYAKALEHYFRALAIWEKLFPPLGRERGGTTLSNIGIIYYYQADYPKALDYYFRALKMDEELGNKRGIAKTLGNIGLVCTDEADYPKALDYYLKALKMAEELGDKNGIARNLANIGNIYGNQTYYPKAFDYYFKALKMSEELGYKQLQAITLGNIGSLYTKTGKFAEAEKYLKHSLALYGSSGELDGTRDFELSLSQLYDTTGRHKLALEHYKKYITAKDSIANDENTKKQTRMEMTYEFDKKQTADSIKNAEQIKQEELKHEQEIQQQKTYTYGGVIGFLLMIVVAMVSFRAFKNKQKANEIIFAQKQLVEEKQKEILDSIRYAKRIQQSLLPTEKYIQKNLTRLQKN